MATQIVPDGATIERFNSRWIGEPNSGCWFWTGPADKKRGIGRIAVRGKCILASRFSFTVHVGPIPDGMCVCHKCDVPLCVNPAHLFLGTHQDNMDDMARKGRGRKPCGRKTRAMSARRAWHAKYDAEVVAEYNAGKTGPAIAASLNVSKQTVCRVLAHHGINRRRPWVQSPLECI